MIDDAGWALWTFLWLVIVLVRRHEAATTGRASTEVRG